MAEDRISTSTEHLKASVKEARGKLTGDAQAEGRGQKREARAADATGTRPTGPDPN